MTVPIPGAIVQRELWGGAVTCAVPARMLDVSDIRPVPDHQEVFLDSDADQALIFEIVEHDGAVADTDCGRHAFEDAAEGNEATSHTLEAVTSLEAAAVPNVPATAYKCLVQGRQMVRRGREAKDTEVMLAVLRFPQVQSDLLISLSTPAAAAESRSEATAIIAQVLATLEILDWRLFGAGSQ
ncbi:hypothetical protein VOLCADRAFT_89409 [Volvox carteri f. nagariensis]|uniref:Mog1p/PsbP-like protein n=1 Tax=Volvox carteri f. nagariensis TaxID=3068 RepID=D8TRM0_VOLCA|nr:uncharacterized protein VOLCADRAFT_89409 [Volvox carteri f. nagariensis]EFJ49918.1 hypothetical protein VOLCADRAFT_89409 [Volvox carteri f. nagariensis]|eukprot:XP_002948983.1 hypothetical protein VOLCADRAFT_89409 [Volvox carteri f. nagariensis]